VFIFFDVLKKPRTIKTKTDLKYSSKLTNYLTFDVKLLALGQRECLQQVAE
jgi:hypothetical protein